MEKPSSVFIFHLHFLLHHFTLTAATYLRQSMTDSNVISYTSQHCTNSTNITHLHQRHHHYFRIIRNNNAIASPPCLIRTEQIFLLKPLRLPQRTIPAINHPLHTLRTDKMLNRKRKESKKNPIHSQCQQLNALIN